MRLRLLILLVASFHVLVTKIEDPPMSFAEYVERSQYPDVWNDSDYAEFSYLWTSNAFGRLKMEELPRECKSHDREMGQKLEKNNRSCKCDQAKI